MYCVSCRADAQSAIHVAVPRSARRRPALRSPTARHYAQRRQDALPIALSERDQPDAGGDQIGGERLQVGEPRHGLDADDGAGATTATGVGERSLGMRSQPQQGVEPRVRPGGAHGFEKGAALRGALQRQLGRSPECLAPGQHLAAACRRHRVRRAMASPKRMASARPEPCAGCPRSMSAGPPRRDDAGFHRVLDAVRVAVAADRKGRRQPGQQPCEVAVSDRRHGRACAGDGLRVRTRRPRRPVRARTARGRGMRAPRPCSMVASTGSSRRRSVPSGRTCTGVCRFPRCQASRAASAVVGRAPRSPLRRPRARDAAAVERQPSPSASVAGRSRSSRKGSPASSGMRMRRRWRCVEGQRRRRNRLRLAPGSRRQHRDRSAHAQNRK